MSGYPLAAMNVTRRQFLAQSAAALAWAALPAAVRAQTARGTLSLGYSLYGMKMVPLAESLRQCARIGYRNLELCLFPGYPAEPAALSKAARRELRAQAQDLNLNLSSLMLSVRMGGDEAAHRQNLAAVQAAVELSHDLSPDRPIPIEAQFGDGKPAQWEATKERSAERLREWAQLLERTGGAVMIGSHAGARINTPEKLLWLYHQAPSPAISLYYNHIHYLLEGYSIAKSWALLGKHSRFIHLQDATGDGQHKNYLLPLLGGPTDFPAYFRLISENGYTGPVVVHISGKFSTAKGYEPIPVAEHCYRDMHQALSESHVRTV